MMSWVYLILIFTLSSAQDYAVQKRPITYTANPQSRISLTGDNFTLFCNVSLSSTSIVQLQWRYNGHSIIENSTKRQYVIFNQDKHILSELSIINATFADEGYYECIVSDGDDAMSTVSSRAHVRIIDSSIQHQVFGPTRVVKNLGQYVILSCEIFNISNEVTWYKNESTIPQNSPKIKLLHSSGSLLIYNMTMEDEGMYHCSTFLAGYLWNGTSYEVFLTNITGSDEPRLLVEPARVIMSQMKMIPIACYFLGLNISCLDYDVVWCGNNNCSISQECTTNYFSVLNIDESINPGIHEYDCKVLRKGQPYLNSTVSVIIESMPTISNSLAVRERVTLPYERYIAMDCPKSSGSNVTFTWYKNGINVTAASNSTGFLKYSSIEDKLTGIYQCFIENNLGSVYSITRVLYRGFANPPENFSCVVVDQPASNNFLPKIMLHWSPPNFNTDSVVTYVVTYRGNHYTTATYYEINLEEEKLNLDIYVSVRNTFLEMNGKKSHCRILDTTERRISQDNVRKIDVSCPSNQTEGMLKWRNPTIPIYPKFGLVYGINLEEYHLRYICLYGKDINMYANISESGSEINDTISIYIPKQPSGSLCIFGGSYHFEGRRSSPLTIPSVICEVPDYMFKGTSQENTSCAEYIASIHVVKSRTNGSIYIEGNCVSADSFILFKINKTLAVTIPELIVDTFLPSYSICSFLTTYIDSSGNSGSSEILQCLENKIIIYHILADTMENVDAISTRYVSTLMPKGTIIDAKLGATLVLMAFFGLTSIIIISVILVVVAYQRQRNMIRKENKWIKAIETLSNEDNCGESISDVEVKVDTPEDAKSDITVFEYLTSEKNANDDQDFKGSLNEYNKHVLPENDYEFDSWIFEEVCTTRLKRDDLMSMSLRLSSTSTADYLNIICSSSYTEPDEHFLT